ncbi:MAG: 2-hydroxyacid dehydrogenase [Flavobacteriaceae bacterium]
MGKTVSSLRWVIIAPQAEVVKWTAAFQQEAPAITLEVGPNVPSPETVDILLLWKHPTGSLAAFTQVKLYYSLGAGVDHLMKDHNLVPAVPICRIVDPLLSFSMSNYILFAVLYHQRRWDKFVQDRRNKIWDHDGKSEEDICIGILGLGTLGKDAALKLHHLGFKVMGYSPSPKDLKGIQTFSKGQLTQFLAACNVLVCTVPSTPETHGLLSKKLFDQLTSPTYLINVARGAVQVEEDILEALESNVLTGAFLDVFEQEPLPKTSPLWTHPNVQITPHIASITNPTAGVVQIINNAKAILNKSSLRNTVNPLKGY